MKTYEIVGVQENSGVIKANNKPWTNYELYCTVETDREIKGLVGKTIEVVKVSASVMKNFVDEVGNNIANDVIGCFVNFEFEKRIYNGVEKIVTTDIIPLN